MANRTVKDAISIKGTNPQYLVEKIIRTRIYECRYWKEDCFALTAELLVDKAMELKSIGGTYGGNIKPAPFLCLVLKMLQIQPEKDIIVEFIRNEDFKYVRALGAFYMRLTGNPVDVYKYLEPLYVDYRKMKKMNKQAKYELIHMDEFIDELLHSERVCDVALPRLTKREALEELNQLEPRISAIDLNLDDEDEDDDEDKEDKEDDSSEKEEERVKNKKKEEYSSSSPTKRPPPHQQQRSKFKYIDYDRPNEDENDDYGNRRPPVNYDSRRRSTSADRRRRSTRRSRSRSRSRSNDLRHHRRDDSRDGRRRRNKSRSRSRERRRRSRSRSAPTSTSSGSKSRSRSRSGDRKRHHHHHHHSSTNSNSKKSRK